MNDSCGLIEMCCAIMVGPPYSVHNSGFVTFPPYTWSVLQLLSFVVVSDYKVLCYVINCCAST